MLKVKLNLKEIPSPEVIIGNKIQMNNGMIVFPFHNYGKVQFVELKETDDDYYQLFLRQGVILDDLIINCVELDINWQCRALQDFLAVNNSIIEEYAQKQLLETIKFLMIMDSYKYYKVSISRNKVLLRIETLLTLELFYEVDIDKHGITYGKGCIRDRQLNKRISPECVEFKFNEFVGEVYKIDDLGIIIENIDEDYLIKMIINGIDLQI